LCGIFGFVGSPERARAIDLDAAIASLRHRGPDDSGRFYSEDSGKGIACAFAHTRLSILDVSDAGRQPMTTADRRFTINYNGEVFNFRELRRELERSGDTFASDCDTEVVLKAFARWGSPAVTRFNGMFAFAIWDDVEKSLFFARDHVGVKPFYYAWNGSRFVFASEIRTLMQSGEVARVLSANGIASYLTFGSVQDPLTILAEANSLLPGHFGVVRDGKVHIERYWSVPDVKAEPIAFADAVQQVRPVLQKAVTSQLTSDVPLGIFLSGGIDSSSIVAIAAQASQTPLRSFTAVFDERAYNEERFAADVARHFGCQHQPVYLTASRAMSEIDGYFKAIDQPSVDGINTYLISKAARDSGLGVALSGAGADELFAGYGSFRTVTRIVAGARLADKCLPDLRPLLRRFDPLRLPTRSAKAIALLLAQGDMQRTYTALRAVFTPNQLEELAPGLASPAVQSAAFTASDSLTQYSNYEVTGYLRNTLLRDTDVMSMAHGLEVRVPIVDYQLVEVLSSLPGSVKLGSTNKPLLTYSVNTLPPEVVGRPKMGFTLPMDVWFRGPLRNRLSEILTDGRIARFGFLDRDRVRGVLESFLRGQRYMSWSRVWTLVTLIDWCVRHDIFDVRGAGT
jgi:asparagine synthase (glutamine-hydrolysing)